MKRANRLLPVFFALCVFLGLFILAAVPVKADSTRWVCTSYIVDDASEGCWGDSPYVNLVDNKFDNQWGSSYSGTKYVAFHTPMSIKPKGYIMTTAPDAAGDYAYRRPTAWNIKAKKKSSDPWTTIHSVANDSTLEAINSKSYEFSISTSDDWQYFLFEVIANRYTGSEEYRYKEVSLAEFQFYSDIDLNDVHYATVSGLRKGYAYTGEPIDIGFTVTAVNGTRLNAGLDYEVSTSPALVQAPGEYTLTITGTGSYIGTRTIAFAVYDPVLYKDCQDRETDPMDGELCIKETTDYVIVDPLTTVWEAGKSYVIVEDTQINDRITVRAGTDESDVRLILCDGVTLTAIKGITVEEAATFHIHPGRVGNGEVEGSGKLVISTPEDSRSGIGGYYAYPDVHSPGIICIYGGEITVTGGGGAAAIGGGRSSGAKEIWIYGGKVTALGGENAAGIGGGNGGPGGKIVITGGEIIATGGDFAAGIGGGPSGPGGNVTITGGDITATGGSRGAGIGGGTTKNGAEVLITGGTVKAKGRFSGAGIGGGANGSGGTVTITGGNVTAEAEAGHDGYGKPIGFGAGIGGGGNLDEADNKGGAGGTVRIEGGTVTVAGAEHAQGVGGGASRKGTQGKLGESGTLTLGTMFVYGSDDAMPASPYTGTRITVDEKNDCARNRYMKFIPHTHKYSLSADSGTITATCTNEDNYHSSDYAVTLTLTAPPHVQYGDGNSEEAVIIDEGRIQGKATVVYYNATVNDGVYAINGSALAAAPTDAGDYVAEITLTDMNTVTASLGYTIAQIKTGDFPSEMYPSGRSGLRNNGNDQALLYAPKTPVPDVCRLEYALGTNDKTVPADGWGETIPTGKETGTYYVWYRIIGDRNYADAEPALITVNIEHKHDPLHYERKEATEEAEGNVEYWECKVCSVLFSDAECTKEIAAENIAIKKLDHDFEHHTRQEPSETSAGNIEYWVCKGCKKFFTDAEGKNEITEAQTVLAKLPDARTVAETPAPVAQSATINDKSVEVKTEVSYPKAVTWTGGTITKEQLSALSEDGVIAKIDASGLKEALTKFNDSKVKPSDLFTIGYTVNGKDVTDSRNKAYFTVKVKLNSKKLKKAGISKDDKKALQTIVDELNKKLEKDPYYFEIRRVKLDEEGVAVSVKAAFSKKKFIQKNEDGTAKKVKAITIKYKVPAGKNGKTKTITKTIKKAAELKKFTVKITDDTKKKKATADITATAENTAFTGTKTGITVKP